MGGEREGRVIQENLGIKRKQELKRGGTRADLYYQGRTGGKWGHVNGGGMEGGLDREGAGEINSA